MTSEQQKTPRRLEHILADMGSDAMSFAGFPVSWFEECCYLIAEGVVGRDGTLGWADHGHFHAAFRMIDRYRQRANW